ncbi:hypothetical protein B0E51_11220 [Rhodanobacter sp. C05]|nr:hypothetical protein B0E51_11220 [Rhodanobacter sp. C05]
MKLFFVAVVAETFAKGRFVEGGRIIAPRRTSGKGLVHFSVTKNAGGGDTTLRTAFRHLSMSAS